jgi:hypothetical protein
MAAGRKKKDGIESTDGRTDGTTELHDILVRTLCQDIAKIYKSSIPENLLNLLYILA